MWEANAEMNQFHLLPVQTELSGLLCHVITAAIFKGNKTQSQLLIVYLKTFFLFQLPACAAHLQYFANI